MEGKQAVGQFPLPVRQAVACLAHSPAVGRGLVELYQIEDGRLEFEPPLPPARRTLETQPHSAARVTQGEPAVHRPEGVGREFGDLVDGLGAVLVDEDAVGLIGTELDTSMLAVGLCGRADERKT